MNTPTLARDINAVPRRLYRGTAVMKFLLSSEDTNGALSIIDAHILKGTEPPPHVHEREDEVFVVKEGAVSFFIGDNVVQATAGDLVFAPRGVAHSFKLETSSAKMMTIITPGGLEQFFWNQSTPYTAGDPVAPVGRPSPGAIAAFVGLLGEYGVRVLT